MEKSDNGGTRHGIPTTIITDNGLQFASAEFKKIAQEWGLKLPAKSLYNSQLNGKAETTVKIVKNIMHKA